MKVSRLEINELGNNQHARDYSNNIIGGRSYDEGTYKAYGDDEYEASDDGFHTSSHMQNWDSQMQINDKVIGEQKLFSPNTLQNTSNSPICNNNNFDQNAVMAELARLRDELQSTVSTLNDVTAKNSRLREEIDTHKAISQGHGARSY